jgi:hypothetical protein
MVRGYWGDISQSPYIPFGVEIWKEPEATKFKKMVNDQQVYSSCEFSMFNIHNYIKVLEDGEQFEYPFERLKTVNKEIGKEDPEDKKKEEEPKVEELTEEEAALFAEKKEEEGVEFNQENYMKEMAGAQKNIDLRAIDEGGFEQSTEGKPDRMLLNGFSKCNVRLHLIAEKDMSTLASKGKFKRLFDVGVLSMASEAGIDQGDYTDLFKDKAMIHAETGDFLVMLKGEQKGQFRTAV